MKQHRGFVYYMEGLMTCVTQAQDYAHQEQRESI